MGWTKEFKEFAVRGNMIDLAVGIILGASFGLIIASLVSDVLMPPLGLLLGSLDFSQLRVVLQAAPDPGTIDASTGLPAGEVAIRYGRFINTLINFLIVALCIFLLIKAINKIRRQEQTPPTAPTKEEVLLTEIRDALRGR